MRTALARIINILPGTSPAPHHLLFDVRVVDDGTIVTDDSISCAIPSDTDPEDFQAAVHAAVLAQVATMTTATGVERVYVTPVQYAGVPTYSV